MKTFKDFVTMNEATKFVTGAEGEEYSLESSTITLASAERINSNSTILFFDVERPSSGQLEVEARRGKVVSVRFWRDGNSDPVDRKDLITGFNRKSIIPDILGLNEEDLEDKVELDEEDFSQIKPHIDKDIKQIRDNLFDDSNTINKVWRTFNAYPGNVNPRALKSLKEVEQLMDKARQILTKI